MASQGEKLLAAELVVVMGVQTADALSGAYTGKFSLPQPSRYFATIVVFLMLSAAALFGEKPGRLAAAFGGVAALGIMLSPSKATGQPVIISALNYFDQMIEGQSYAVANPQTPSSGPLPLTPSGTVAAAPAGSPAPATAITDINTAITELQQYIAKNCTGKNANSAACVLAKQNLKSLQTQGFGNPGVTPGANIKGKGSIVNPFIP